MKLPMSCERAGLSFNHLERIGVMMSYERLSKRLLHPV